MTDNLDPNDFNIDDWITGARAPQESVVIYQRPDVLADITRLQNEIRDAKAAEDLEEITERPLAWVSEVDRLTMEYRKALELFNDSRLVVYVQALTDEVRQSVFDEVKALYTTEELESVDPEDKVNVDLGQRLLARSVVGVRRNDDTETRPIQFTIESISRFASAIGPAQWSAVVQAYNTAQNRYPAPSADFLL